MASFLKTTKDNSRKVFIDVPESIAQVTTKEVIFSSEENIISVGKNHEKYEEFTEIKEIPILESRNTKLSNTRIGIEVSVSYNGDSFGEWDQPKLVTQIIRNGQSIKWTGVRIPIVMNNRNHDTISYNFICPELKIGDKIQCLIWNTTKDVIIVNGFKLIEIQ